MEASEQLPTPGQAIQQELAMRGWTQDDLAKIIGRYRPEVSAVVSGKRGVSPELAIALAAALGHTPEHWLRLEAARQLSLIPQDANSISRRVRMYQLAPLTAMMRRKWVSASSTDDELESELCQFFEIQTLTDEPRLSIAPRAASTTQLTPGQRAWGFRARYLAKSVAAATFNADGVDHAESELRKLAAYPAETPKVARVLAEHGIRLVLVERLPQEKIDGAVFWLDANSPVIAMSLYHDRNDNFWFTLMHELSHVRHGDALSVDDTEARGEPDAAHERRANAEASAALVPPDELKSFVLRAGPIYHSERIIQFAHRIKMHPGVIVGQLRHRGEVGYDSHTALVAKVRDRIVGTTITDGWGHVVER